MEFYTKTAYPCGHSWLEGDSALEYSSLHVLRHVEGGDNEETMADADLWLLCSSHHRQHTNERSGWNVVQGGASVLFLFLFLVIPSLAWVAF